MTGLPRILQLDLSTVGAVQQVTPHPLGAVVHTPSRRDFYSGNSVYLHETPSDLGPVLDLWAEAFQSVDDVGRFVLQWEAPTDLRLPDVVQRQAEELGLELSRTDLMRLGDLRADPRAPDVAATAAVSDTDWACVGALLGWMNPETPPAFWRWMGAEAFRASAEAGHTSSWLVHRHAEPASMVTIGTGSGGGYVSAVVTHPAHRGSGLAAALTHHACEVHRWRHPDHEIHLGADPGGAPGRMYERLGFRTVSGWWELTGDAARVRERLAGAGAGRAAR